MTEIRFQNEIFYRRVFVMQNKEKEAKINYILIAPKSTFYVRYATTFAGTLFFCRTLWKKWQCILQFYSVNNKFNRNLQCLTCIVWILWISIGHSVWENINKGQVPITKYKCFTVFNNLDFKTLKKSFEELLFKIIE
jgi:hypothetical protein